MSLTKINPLDVFLWTFRRNQNDVINLYNSLSPVMQLATGGNMLNFGYWQNNVTPIQAQEKLCDLVGNLAELSSGDTLLDVGSGISAPAIYWESQFNPLEIYSININHNQICDAKELIRQESSPSKITPIESSSIHIPFSNNCFDRVIALESAQHFKPFETFLSESKRVLKNDGIFSFAIPVTKQNPTLKNLGILSVTWSSEHYTEEFILEKTSEQFEILDRSLIGSLVYDPLTDYYTKHRKQLKEKIMTQFPSYLEKILFKSLQKMKQASQQKTIDYLLVKCQK